MRSKRIILWALVVLTLVDLGYSFKQYCNYPTDGDMPSHLVPEDCFQKVLDSPLGFDVVASEEKYPDPNRFFMHYPYYLTMNFLPTYLAKFMAPVKAIYVAMGAIKIIVHLVLLLLMGIYINAGLKLKKLTFWISLLAVSAFFQANAHSTLRIGIIDPSITYTFAYGFQMIFVLLYFMPLVMKYYFKRSVPIFDRLKWLWLPLALMINLGSPLTPGIVLVIALLYLIYHTVKIIRSRNRSLINYFRRIPSDIYFYLLPAGLFALYSLYIGTYNTNTMLYADQMTLSEAYQLLPYGIVNQFIWNPAYLCLIILLISAYITLGKNEHPSVVRFRRLFFWSVMFAAIYIILLPLGGYKPYRPYTLRYDSILPITLILIMLFIHSVILIKRHIPLQKLKNSFLLLVGLFLGLMFYLDKPEFWRNDVERAALEEIADSTEDTVELVDYPHTIMSWTLMESAEDSHGAAELLHKWKVTDRKRLYYQAEQE